MLETILAITLSTKQLCVRAKESNALIKCYPISIGCPGTPTPIGDFLIRYIYLNPLPVSPSGKEYNPAKLGGLVITTNRRVNKGIFAIHGWDQSETIGVDCSMGCIRMKNDDIQDLIWNYYFNALKIDE
jgi:lipoprotein-anchoring transpeptidase ErfK/SrfK